MQESAAPEEEEARWPTSERWTRFRSCSCTTPRVRGGRPAIREKDLGIWQTWTWQRFADEVRALACGLPREGLRRGEPPRAGRATTARASTRRCAPRSAWAAIPVPLYQDAVADRDGVPDPERARSRIAFAEDQEQVDKLLEILPQCPTLKRIYYDDPRGLRHYTQPQLRSYDELLEPAGSKTRSRLRRRRDRQGQRRRRRRHVLHLGHHRRRRRAWCSRTPACIDRRAPRPRWSGSATTTWSSPTCRRRGSARTSSPTRSRSSPATASAAPSRAETVMTDMREIGPTYYFAPPRVLEALLTQVSIRMEDAAAPKRWLYRNFMGVAEPRRRRAARRQAGVGLLDRALVLRWATCWSTGRCATCSA